mmetsp:Transcript_27708/g.76281  ORF Transcript_27708/g.76281 Transcript_27708/m.76281 type:complete len:209 (+) Transcript_27708:2430-3056(+)
MRSDSRVPGKANNSHVPLKRQKCSLTVVTVLTMPVTQPPNPSVTCFSPESKSFNSVHPSLQRSQAANRRVTTCSEAAHSSNEAWCATHQPGSPDRPSNTLKKPEAPPFVANSVRRYLSSYACGTSAGYCGCRVLFSTLRTLRRALSTCSLSRNSRWLASDLHWKARKASQANHTSTGTLIPDYASQLCLRALWRREGSSPGLGNKRLT